ncbi:MAG TPA: ABC transporter permease, partial [Anaerolineae bacterium]
MRRRDVLLASTLALIVWQIIAMLVQRDILPTPIQVAQALAINFGEIGRHFVASALRVILSII